jgi:hypothetical protein
MQESNGFQQFRPFQPGEFIMCFVDPSHGAGDNTAAQYLSQKWLDIPRIYHSPYTITAVTPLLHQDLTRISKETGVAPIVAYETNNGGDFELERLARLNRYGDYRIYTMKQLDPVAQEIVDTGKLGWNTNTATRPKMLRELKEAVESELLHIYHRQTVDEMFSFIINGSGKPEAEENAHDDLVMALAGVWQLYQTEQPKSVANDDPSSYVSLPNVPGHSQSVPLNGVGISPSLDAILNRGNDRSPW